MKRSYKIFLLFNIISISLFAQQAKLVPPTFNPVIKQYLHNHPEAMQMRVHAPGDTLDLPFRDDFSNPSIYPDANKWSDNKVFVNDDLARNPPTIGVATFDGLDANGNAYNSTNSTAQGSADTLTSQPINLDEHGGTPYTLSDSITLTFFYQKKGYGDGLENNDSLILEFYKPSTQLWHHQWSVRGGSVTSTDSSFTRVNYTLRDSTFFEKGFRFRFRSYGSLSGLMDLWHLDYVLLKDYQGVFSDDLQELAFVKRNISIIHPYTSMPWNHFKIHQSPYLINTIPMRLKSFHAAPFAIDFRNMLKDKDGNIVYADAPISTNVFSGADSIALFDNLPDSLEATSSDSALFTTTHMMSILSGVNLNPPDFIRTNDSVVFSYPFYNYYSYDDGTAENGFDLIGAPAGKVAMRFDLAQADSLRAVRMLFLQQNANASNQLFTLKIWSSLSPETVIYQQQNLKPVYTDSIDGMATYVIPPLFVSGSIYIGFQQPGSTGLHLGFDYNTKNNSTMSYNTGAGWIPFALADGSFMIRAVMGGSDLFQGVNEINKEESDVFVYPNPASDFIYFNNASHSSIQSASLCDATGREVLNEQLANRSSLDVKSLAEGFYVLNFMDNDHHIISSKKVLISH